MKKISQYIGILIIVTVAALSAFTRPSPAPNNNNVFPLVDSLNVQQVKEGAVANEGGVGVHTLFVGQAARFDASVFINRFISGATTDEPDVFVGTQDKIVTTVAQGDIEAGEYLQADNLKNDSMRRVCRDPAGILVLCDVGNITTDTCPNIEGIQSQAWLDANSALFVKDGTSCVKPGTTVATPPPTPPVEPTIEVRYIAVSKKSQTTLSVTTEDYFQKKTTTWFAPIFRINFGSATTAPITFNVGYCTNHGIGSPMQFCRGIPLTFDGRLVSPDSPLPAWGNQGNTLISPYNWSGQHPTCAATAQWRNCDPALRGPVDTRDFGRNQITIPAGTTDTGWILYGDNRWSDTQKWNPPSPNSFEYYAQWLVYKSAPYRNYVPDMTNMYFFNISDTSGVFDSTKLKNLSKSTYKLIWDRSKTY